MPTLAQTKSKIVALLAAAFKDGKDRIRQQELRTWAAEYLGDYDEEVVRFPRIATESHWNLWMQDTGSDRYAPFTLILFRPATMELFCGRGDSNRVRVLVESDFPEDAEKIIKVMRRKFSLSQEPLTIDRQVAEAWLGRPFSISSGSVDRPQGRRFEYTKDHSSKFWEVAATDREVTVRFGRIGTNGQEKTKKFRTASAATAYSEKLIEEKKAKGYKERKPRK